MKPFEMMLVVGARSAWQVEQRRCEGVVGRVRKEVGWVGGEDEGLLLVVLVVEVEVRRRKGMLGRR